MNNLPNTYEQFSGFSGSNDNYPYPCKRSLRPHRNSRPNMNNVTDAGVKEESDSAESEPEVSNNVKFFKDFDKRKLKEMRIMRKQERKRRKQERKKLVRDLQLKQFMQESNATPPSVAASSVANFQGLANASNSLTVVHNTASPKNMAKKFEFFQNTHRFRSVMELLSPQLYLLQPGVDSTFIFHLSPQAVQLISEDNSALDGYTYGVLLRISQFDHSVDMFYDFFPSNIKITINSEILRLFGKQSSFIQKPIDLSELIMCRNELKLNLQSHKSLNIVLGVYFVHLLTVEKALHSYKFDFLWRTARRERDAENDLFGMSGSTQLSLICPLSNKRIEIPCVGADCTHYQCFDLKAFLKIHHRTFQWKCPICNRWMRNVVRDRLFSKIIDNVSLACVEVGLQRNNSSFVELTHENQQLNVNEDFLESSVIEDIYIEHIH